MENNKICGECVAFVEIITKILVQLHKSPETVAKATTLVSKPVEVTLPVLVWKYLEAINEEPGLDMGVIIASAFMDRFVMYDKTMLVAAISEGLAHLNEQKGIADGGSHTNTARLN